MLTMALMSCTRLCVDISYCTHSPCSDIRTWGVLSKINIKCHSHGTCFYIVIFDDSEIPLNIHYGCVPFIFLRYDTIPILTKRYQYDTIRYQLIKTFCKTIYSNLNSTSTSTRTSTSPNTNTRTRTNTSTSTSISTRTSTSTSTVQALAVPVPVQYKN